MLPFSDEPAELRDRLRALAAVAPVQARSRLAQEVAAIAAGELRLLGDSTAAIDVDAICRGYQRELWLWLVGERTWAQCANGLRGRLRRRGAAVRP